MSLQLKVGADIKDAIVGLSEIDSALDKTQKATASAATGMSKSLSGIKPASDEVGDALARAFSKISSVDLSSSFEDASKRINASIDGISSGINQKLASSLAAFGGGVKAFTSSFTGFDDLSVNAAKSLNDLEKEIKHFQDKLNNSTDLTKIKRYGDQIDRLRTQANNLKVVGLETTLGKINAAASVSSVKMGAVAGSSNQAHNALLGVSRVVQDLPFGFQGIANNITELPGLFRQLSVSAKESGKSLGSVLLQSLRGAGGFGLILSGVTTALTFASVGLASWTRGLGGSTKETDKAIERNKEFKEILNSVAEDLSKEATRATVLFEALRSGNLSLTERTSALKELKTINSDYFGALKEENGLVVGLEAAYDKYLAKINEIGRAKAIEAKITKLFSRKLELELSVDPKFIEVATIGERNIIGDLQRQLTELGGAVDLNTEKFDAYNVTQQKRIELQKQINKLIAGERNDKTFTEIDKITRQLGFLQKLLGNSTEFDIKVPAGREAKKSLDEVTRFAKAIQDSFTVPDSIRITGFETDEQALIKARETIQGFFNRSREGSFFKFKVTPDISFSEPEAKSSLSELTGEILKLFDQDIQGAKGVSQRAGAILGKSFVDGVKDVTSTPDVLDSSLFQIQALEAQFKKEFESLGANMPRVDLSKGFYFNAQQLTAKLASLKLTVASGLEDVFKNAFVNISSSLGDTLADTLSGRDPGEGLKSAFGGLLTDLGKALIKYGAIKEGLDKILGPGGVVIPGGVAIALGVLSIAAGKALKNFGGAREKGGPISPNKSWLVGENGPEIIIPRHAGRVIPNDKLGDASRASAMGGGVALDVRVIGDIRHDRIVLSNQRGNRSLRRRT